jgi:hypothetical protein
LAGTEEIRGFQQSRNVFVVRDLVERPRRGTVLPVR